MDFGFVAVPAAFLLAYCLVPPATSRLLAFKYHEINRTWDASLQAYEDHVRQTGHKPLFGPAREERSLAQWARRQVSLAKAKKLSFERVLALRMADILPNPPAGCDTTSALQREKEVEENYQLRFGISTRVFCGLLLALAALPLFYCGIPIAGAAAGIAAGALMEVTYLCDMQARIIPYQICYAFGAAAVVFTCATGGFQGLATSVFVAIGMSVALQFANTVMSYLSGSPAIGAGDLRFIPMVCLFSGLTGSLLGFAGASVVMAVIAIFVVVAKGGNRRSYVPYAPGLGCWYAIGLLSQVYCV